MPTTVLQSDLAKLQLNYTHLYVYYFDAICPCTCSLFRVGYRYRFRLRLIIRYAPAVLISNLIVRGGALTRFGVMIHLVLSRVRFAFGFIAPIEYCVTLPLAICFCSLAVEEITPGWTWTITSADFTFQSTDQIYLPNNRYVSVTRECLAGGSTGKTKQVINLREGSLREGYCPGNLFYLTNKLNGFKKSNLKTVFEKIQRLK